MYNLLLITYLYLVFIFVCNTFFTYEFLLSDDTSLEIELYLRFKKAIKITIYNNYECWINRCR